jgi:hypothetical protein
MHKSRRLSLLLAGLAALGGGPAEGATRRYLLDVHEADDVAFEVRFDAPHPGTLVVSAEWEGTRIVSFRLDGPGAPSALERRSGPSPQRMEVELTPKLLVAGNGFTLSIRTPPGRGVARGTVTIETPDAPEVVEERRRDAEPPPPPPPAPDPWTLPVKAPPDSTAAVQAVFAAVERFRVLAVGPDGQPSPDACGWRADLLRRVAGWRDDVAAGRSVVPSAPDLRFLQRLAAAVRDVDELRNLSDPILAAPAPTDPLRKRALEQARRDRIRPLERRLDELSEALRGGLAPGLKEESWPPRLVACLTGCERYYEERARLGDEEAPNADLAKAQWPSILAAAAAFESLEPFAPTTAVPKAGP